MPEHNYCVTLNGKQFCFTPYVNQDGPHVLITIDGHDPLSLTTQDAQTFAMDIKLFAREADSLQRQKPHTSQPDKQEHQS